MDTPNDNLSEYGGTPPLRRCKKCVMPETQDAITFDKDGVCSVCRQIEYKQTKIDWQDRKRELSELLDNYRGKYDYDCIIPFSGGKDSTYQAYVLVKEFKVKPLLVSFDHGFYRPKHLMNVERTIKNLGVDYLKFRPNWHIVKKVMMESFKRKGDFCWHCHTGIYAYPIRIAVKFNIPLIMWGESIAEYMSTFNFEEAEQVDEERFNKVMNLGITAEDMHGMLNDPDISLRDLLPYTYPKPSETRKIGLKSVCLGSYIPWDTKTQSEIIKKELGWEGNEVEGIPSQYDYEKVECGMQGMRDYIKFIKRGFGRTAHLTSIDIRNNRMGREQGMKLTKEYDGKKPASLEIFLKTLNISEGEFNKISASHMISPYVHDFTKTKKGKKLDDQDQWHIND